MIPALPPATNLPPPVTAAARTSDAGAAAAAFESLLARELLRAMRSTTTALAGTDGAGFALDTAYAMFDDALSEAVAGRLGVAPILERALAPIETGATADRRPRGRVVLPPADAPPPGAAIPAIAATGPLPAQAARPLAAAVVTSPYGPRVHPVTKAPSFHAGLDLAAPEGAEIYAVRPGVVRWAGRHGAHGLMVEIEHDDGTRTRYAHASRIHVRRGDRVDAGEAVADVGATGRATGPHLHLEVLRGGRTVDPAAYLERFGVGLPAPPKAPADESKESAHAAF